MTPRIDFYILKKERQAAYSFLARLVEKIYSLEKTVLIFANSQTQAEYLDDLLWSYQEESFLPHEIYSPSAEGSGSAIMISTSEEVTANVLINLQTQLPTFFRNFERVVELVYDQDEVPQQGRQKYRQYRDSGYQINTIHID